MSSELRPVPDPDSVSSGDVPELRASLSDAALELVNGERQNAYGPPQVHLRRVGEIWAGILDLPEPVPPHLVALCMAGLKLAREAHRHGADNLTDAVGYLEIVRHLRSLG